MIRLDSFSKVISSGIRVGFLTAAAPLIATIEFHLQSSHLHAPTLSQVGRTTPIPRENSPFCRAQATPSLVNVNCIVRTRVSSYDKILTSKFMVGLLLTMEHAFSLNFPVYDFLNFFLNSHTRHSRACRRVTFASHWSALPGMLGCVCVLKCTSKSIGR